MEKNKELYKTDANYRRGYKAGAKHCHEGGDVDDIGDYNSSIYNQAKLDGYLDSLDGHV